MENANPRELTFVKGLMESVLDPSAKPSLREAKYEAILLAKGLTDKYAAWGVRNDLLDVIMQKKTELILAADSVSDAKRAAKPPKPRYNGAAWIEDPFTVPEEELVLWLQMALDHNPTEIAYKRIVKLFTQVVGITEEELIRTARQINGR